MVYIVGYKCYITANIGSAAQINDTKEIKIIVLKKINKKRIDSPCLAITNK
jgi:hypothetical protein